MDNRILVSMKTPRDIIIIGTIILTALMVMLWYIFFEMGLDIPQFIPETPVKIYGLFMFGALFTVFIIAEKRILKQDTSISILKLTLNVFMIGVIAEIAFQIVRCYTGGFTIKDFVIANLVMGLYSFITAFLIAYQLKTKKTRNLILFIAVVVLIANVANRLFGY